MSTITLKNTFNTWSNLLRQKDNSIMMIARRNDEWLVSHQGCIVSPKTLQMVLLFGENQFETYSNSEAHFDAQTTDLCILICNGTKMILRRENTFTAFGIQNEQAPAKQMLLYFCTDTLHASLIARASDQKLLFTYAPIEKKKSTATLGIIDHIFNECELGNTCIPL